jgi:cyclopropane-fatty-acyl-phospholipid synthase
VFYGNPLVAFMLRVTHALRANTRAGAKKNIFAHYDLGNEFYRLWLDPSMTYSSAVFSSRDQTLESGQDAKYERILATLGIDKTHHVLEIGCGWGGFAEYAARTRGCRVTGITISRAQLEYAQDRIRRAGLDSLVELRFCDYRDLQGEFDRVVSIEMVEAVGERYWPEYFSTLHRSLKPGGRACIRPSPSTRPPSAVPQTSDFIRSTFSPAASLRWARPALARPRAGLACPSASARTTRELRRWRVSSPRETAIRKLGLMTLSSLFGVPSTIAKPARCGRIDVVQMELARLPRKPISDPGEGGGQDQ